MKHYFACIGKRIWNKQSNDYVFVTVIRSEAIKGKANALKYANKIVRQLNDINDKTELEFDYQSEFEYELVETGY